MIKLTRSQTRQLEGIGIKWTPDTAEFIVSIVAAVGLPVYNLTLNNPKRSASGFQVFVLYGATFCGSGEYGRKVISIDEFIVYLFTEVLV